MLNMAEIDIKTFFYIFTLCNAFVIPFFIAYFYFYKINNLVSRLFILARILSIVGILLIVLRRNNPTYLNIAITNILLITGLSYEVFCIIYINKIFSSKKFIYHAILTLCLIIGSLFFYNSSEVTRVIVFSIIGVFIYSFGVYFSFHEKNNTKIQKISAYLFLLTVFVYTIRVLKGIYSPNDAYLFANNPIQVISYVYLLLFTFFAPIVIILILNEEANLKLIQLNKNKTKFFSIIAHDLRGPLGTLSQIGELLWKNDNLIDENRRAKLTESIYKTSKDSFTLLDNLLKWASANSGNIVYEPLKLNLKDIATNAVSFFSDVADLKHIKLVSKIEDDLYVYADLNMVETIIRNLLSNALKFTPKNGKIYIIDEIQHTSTNNHIIKIVDNGVGMSKQVIDTIFELNSYVSTKGTENETGTGVGLKLCKEFIQINKGDIWVKGEENKGAAFFISLPKYR
jgi:signal transduction histidine kinase